MAVERCGEFLIVHDLAGCRRALRVTEIAEVRDYDESAQEAAVVTRRGEAIVLRSGFDEVLPLVLLARERATPRR